MINRESGAMRKRLAHSLRYNRAHRRRLLATESWQVYHKRGIRAAIQHGNVRAKPYIRVY